MQSALFRYLARPNRDYLLLALLLAVTTILAYQPAWHGGFIWDDDAYITNNELLTAPDGLRRIWFSLDSPSQYFPLVYTMFRFEHAWWGLSPTGYHFVNILLHIANALILWGLLARLRVPGAWLAGAIFALHPVQVESVAWITERKNVLMGFFFLLTIRAWVEFVDEQTKHRWFFYVLALVLYALALFSKTTACTLPAALLLILWLQGQRINQRRLLQLVPFVVLALGMGLLTVWWERYHQGTHGPNVRHKSARASSHCQPSYLVLPGQTILAIESYFHLSAMDISPTDLLDYASVLGIGGLCAAIYLRKTLSGTRGRDSQCYSLSRPSARYSASSCSIPFATPLWQTITNTWPASVQSRLLPPVSQLWLLRSKRAVISSSAQRFVLLRRSPCLPGAKARCMLTLKRSGGPRLPEILVAGWLIIIWASSFHRKARLTKRLLITGKRWK